MYNNYNPRARKMQGETSNKIKRIMKIAAITAEFNPLHNGHLKLIDKARELSPDILLIILNGDITQRGEPALLDKYTRARHAVLAGADVVIELPQVFGAACAERFADAAVKLLSAIPADERILYFGSEEGEIEPLLNAAKILSDEPMELSVDMRELMDMGFSYPAARAEAFATYTKERGIKVADLTKPNNILAVEYLRAIEKRGGVTPCTIKRSGDYHSEIIDDSAPSASAIRTALEEGRGEAVTSALPPYVAEDVIRAPDKDYFSPIVLFRLGEMTADELSEIADVKEGIENRILRLAKESTDVPSLVKAVSTKRYTASRVRRILVNALLGTSQETFDKAVDEAPYYKVLAVKKAKTDALSLLSRAGALITGEEEARESGITSAILCAKAHDLYRIVKAAEFDDGMLIL